MRNRYNLHNLGREIGGAVREAVQGAVRLEDVEHLKGSLDDIMVELSQMGRELSRPLGAPEAPQEPREPRRTTSPREKTVVYSTPATTPAVPKGVSARSVSGIVLTVLGFVLSGISTVLGIAWLGTFWMGQTTLIPGAELALSVVGGLFAVCTAGSTFLLVKGKSLRKRAKRYFEYLRLFGGCKLYPVEQLAIITDCSKGRVIRDLRHMIHTNRLPGAHLDAERTTLILDEETYQQYLLTEQKRRAMTKQDKKQLASPPPQPETTEASPHDTLIGEGRAYIERIRATNPIIHNEVVSGKIDQIADTVSKIFDYVSEHPDKQGDLRRLMSYYLPTTLELLEAYSKFEAHAVRGENVNTAMREIEGALDTICLAFANLLDDLFEHEMYDITSNISALETVLAQEGLTAQDFAGTDPRKEEL